MGKYDWRKGAEPTGGPDYDPDYDDEIEEDDYYDALESRADEARGK